MNIAWHITTSLAALAASIVPSVMGLKAGIALFLGALAVVALSAWWRRREAGADPLRSLAPPAGRLRFARRVWMRSATD